MEIIKNVGFIRGLVHYRPRLTSELQLMFWYIKMLPSSRHELRISNQIHLLLSLTLKFVQWKYHMIPSCLVFCWFWVFGVFFQETSSKALLVPHTATSMRQYIWTPFVLHTNGYSLFMICRVSPKFTLTGIASSIC